jgi:hypothetical protein
MRPLVTEAAKAKTIPTVSSAEPLVIARTSRASDPAQGPPRAHATHLAAM